MADDTNELLENSVANLVNAESKLTRQEVDGENGNEIQNELSAIQQSTAALNANTQAQRSYNEEKRKSITIQEAISNAYKQAGSEFKNDPLSRDLFGNRNIQLQYDSNGKVSVGVNSSLSKSEKAKYLKNGGQEELDEANIALRVNDYVKQEFDSTLDEILKFKGSGEDFNQLEEDLKQAYQHLYNQLIGKAIVDFQSGAFSVKDFNPANINPNAALNTSLGLQQKYNYISSFEDERIRQQNWNNVGRIESERSQAFTQITPLMQELENSILDVVNDNNFETKAKKAQDALKELEALFDLYSEIDPEDTSNNLEVFMKNSEYLKKIASSFRASSFADEIDESAFRNESQDFLREIKDNELERIKNILNPNKLLANIAAEQGVDPSKAGDVSKLVGDTFRKVAGIDISAFGVNRAKRESPLNELISNGIDDSKIRDLRLMVDDFYKINSYVNKIREDPLRTFSEKELIKNFDKNRDTLGAFSRKDKDGEIIDGSGALGRFEESRNALLKLNDELNDNTKSEEEKIELYRESKEIIDDYNEKLKALLETISNLNKETESSIKDEKAKDRTAKEKHDNNTDSYYGKKNYNYWKYAWKRDAQQQKDFEESGEMPSNFSTTGNWRDSMAKTLFNKSVGYRQRQGLVGLLSNVGYAKSGVGLSIGLGTLATAVTKAGKAVMQFAQESTVAYGEIQSIKTNLGIVSGSQAEADQTFSEIAAYSVKSPFGVQTVSEFAVLLKQSGVYASDLMDTLKQIGDVAGGNQEKFANIANAFSQIEANGKATTRQLRQFATAGIPVYRELSKELGVGIDQIRKMTEQGEISSKVIEKVFANMTGEGGVFENAVNIGAKTWKARQQNLADAKQLAQAAFGEFLIGFGGTGRGDSIAEQILGLKEGIYEIVNHLFTLQNINNNVSKIANQDNEVQRLQKELEILEAGGASEDVLQAKRDQIVAAATYLTDDQQRAYARTAYETVMSEFNGKQEIDLEQYKELEKQAYNSELAGYSVIDRDGKKVVVVRDFGSRNASQMFKDANISYEQYAAKKATQEDAKLKLGQVYTRDQYNEAYEKVKDLQGMTNISMALESTKRGFELLDKSINSNPYNPSNKTGLYAQLQQSASKYEQTEEGKKKKEEQDRIDWENMRSLWDTYSQYIGEDGRLMRNFAGTAEEAIEMMTSGIITPLENISLAPEDLAKDWVGLTNLTGDERAKKEEELNSLTDEVIDNFRNQAISIMNFSDTTDTSRQVLMRFVGSLIQAEQMIKSGLGVQGTEYLSTIYNNAISDLEKLGQGNAASILSMATTRTSRTEKAKSWDELNSSKSNSKDTYPLWQRILNQSFGTSLDLFKNGAITRGDQAVNLWATQQKRQGIQNMSRSMLNTMNYKDVMSNLAYSGGNYVIGNTSKLGVTQIDWDKTYKNFSKFSMSLESAAEVTRAYSDSLQSDVDTLRDFMSSAFTITEDAANVYDPEYQKHLGDLSKNIKALDANAYDMMFTVDKDTGLITLRENATSAAQALLEEKQTMLTFADSVATAKESIKQMNDEIRATSISRDINLGAYDNYSQMKGLTKDEQGKFINFLSGEFNNDKWTALLKEYDVTSDQAIKSYLSGNKFTGAITNDKFEEKERLQSELDIAQKTLEEITPKMVEAFIEANTNVKNAIPIAERKDKDIAWLNAVENNDKKYMTDVAMRYGGAEGSNKFSGDYTKAVETVNNLTRQIAELGDVSETTALSFDDLYASFDEYLNKIKESYLVERQEMFSQGFRNLALQNIEEGKVGEDYLRSIWAGDSVSEGNTLKQQRILDYMGIDKGYTFKDAFDTTFSTDAGKEFIKSFMSSFTAADIAKYRGNDEVISGLASGYKDFSKLTGQDVDPESVKETIEAIVDSGNIESIRTLFEYLAGIQEETDLLKNTFSDLGKTIKDTLVNSIEQGITDTFVTMGKHVKQIVSNTGVAIDSAKDYADVWKNVAQQMLSSIGPAATQAGLSLLMKGQIGPGMALIAAGGILSFMSGLFEQDDNRSKDEENRIKTLKDLLADLIDQAKTDALYYEKNFKHENALSEANKISVNDAIITPNGNVVSTHPDDYLIATKTPGSLIGSGKGDTVVNFTVIDKSQKGLNVQTEKKENEDGSVDIIAIVTDAVGQAIADGSMDGAFAARDMRMNGNSYAY